MHSYAACSNQTPNFPPYVPVRKPQLIKKHASLLWVCSIHAAPLSFYARTLVARRGISHLLLILFRLFFSIPRLRSIRILRARSPRNRPLRSPLRNISRRQLSLRLHMRANRIRDSPGRMRRESDSLEGILGLLARGQVFGFQEANL
jgi:hypothetical protein